jgi:DNA-binding NarL/FixJ family response regulator
MAIRVYIVEKQKIVREGLKAVMLRKENINVAGDAASLDRLPSLSECDVLLFDQNGDIDAFLKKVRGIKKKYPSIKIITLTDADNSLEVLQDMLETGVNGYLTKNASAEELNHSVFKVFDDGSYICTGFVLRLLKNFKHTVVNPKRIELKESEQIVLNLIAEGLTNQDIADQLKISVRTVETRRQKILEKTGSVNTAVLIRFAAENGLLE